MNEATTATSTAPQPPTFEDFEGTIARAALDVEGMGEKLKAKQLGLCLSPYLVPDEDGLVGLPDRAVIRDDQGNVMLRCERPNEDEDEEAPVTAADVYWHVADCWDQDLETDEVFLPALVLWPTGWRPAVAK